MSAPHLTLIALLVCSALWASGGAAAKALLPTFDPITIGAIRLTMAAVLIFPLFLRATPKISWKLIKDALPAALLLGGNFFFFLFGISKTTANASTIIYTAAPLIVALTSSFLIAEHISKQKIRGILVGLTGVLVILLLPLIEQGQMVGDTEGNLIIVCAMLVFALYNVSVRHLVTTKGYNPLTITSLSLFVSAIGFDVLYILKSPGTITFPTFTPFTFWVCLYFALGVTVIPYALHQWAIKRSSATTGSLTMYIQPVFGFVINGLLLGEVLTGRFLVGCLLVFVGTFMASGIKMPKMFKK